ncbi:MAG TPA: dihydrodipicolinate synthase family protein [Gemmatimonadales bacterium]|nr:dihydrodipicolinate synthase family protein [Gemmatimonadales bacterium]
MALSASVLAGRLAHGLVPAVPVPHRADGAFDAAAQERYAAWMARQRIAGVAVWAHTGRGLHLAEETAAAVLSSWRRALGPERLIVAGAGARPRVAAGQRAARLTPPADPLGLTAFVIERTVAMARQARDLGADAILALPPALLANLEDHESRIVDVHAALADVGLPVLAFWLYPAAGGCAYGPELLERLLALPHVAGLKVATLDSVVRFQEIAARVPPGKLLVTGEDRFLGYSLMMGAGSALIGLGAARTALPAGLLEAHARRDHERFLDLAAACDRLGAAAFTEPVDGYVRRMLWLLALGNVIPREAAFDPWGPSVPDSQLEALERVARGLPDS